MKTLLRIFLVFLFAFFTSCGQKSKTIKSVELVGELPQVAGVTPDLPVGATEKFKAVGVFDDNHWEDKSSEVTWSTNMECPTASSPGSSGDSVATVSSDGTVTGVSRGTIFVVAVLDSYIGCFSLSVSGAALVSIDVTPTNPTIVTGTTQQFIATATYSDGTTSDISSSATWSTSNALIATVSNLGLATGALHGVAAITATKGSISGNTNLTVTQGVLVSVAVTPTNPSVPFGLTKQFTATGTYSDGSTQDITNTVAWTSSDGAVATVGVTGLATTTGIGNTTITATSGVLTGTSVLTVTAATLASIAVTPANPSVPLGLTKQFTATGTYTDNTTQDLTATVVWSSSNLPIATISNAGGSNGLATTHSLGATTITAASGAISGSTVLTVTAASLVSIAVTPAAPSIAKGLAQQFTATGTYTDASTQNITTSVVWTTSDATVATVSNAAGSKGLAQSVAVGNTTITATSGIITGSQVLTVTAAVLQSIAVTPSSSTISKTHTRQYTATGTYSDASTADITTSVTWTSSTITTATISNAGGSQGLATGVNIGFVTFTATLGAVHANTTATVIP